MQDTQRHERFHSLKWWWAIRDHEDLSPSLRFVAMVTGSFADERGEVRPSLDRLKADTGLSHAQLKRLRGQLVKLGYLVPVKAGKGRGQASIYRLSFPAGKRLIEPSLKQLIPSKENGSSDEPLREIGSDTSALKSGVEELHQEVDLLVAPGSPYGEVVEFPTSSVEHQTVTTKNHSVSTTSPVATERRKVATPKQLPWARERPEMDARRKPHAGELYVLDLDGVGGRPLTLGEVGLFGENEEAPDELSALHEPMTRERRAVGTP